MDDTLFDLMFIDDSGNRKIVLEKEITPKTVQVDTEDGDVLHQVLAPFDVDASSESQFYPYKSIQHLLPNEYNIGLIVGSSGSGKSTLGETFGKTALVEWDGRKAIAQQFGSAQEAISKLSAVGLNTVPTWKQPYHTLSTGQKFRADLARSLRDGAVIDEFTSVVDRNVAKSASKSVSTHIRRNGISKVVFISCHRDIIEWLRPDWVADLDGGFLTIGEFDDVEPKWYMQHVIEKNVGSVSYAQS